MKKYIPESMKRLGRRLLLPVPSRISERFVKVDEAGLRSIENSIRDNYHKGWRSESNYSKKEYENDLNDHLCGRLEMDRKVIIPWLDNATALQDKRILEVGCGTGSSTIALAEQGAKISGIDIDEGALVVARERADVYGMDVEFRTVNAQNLSSTFEATRFDLIIFFACLEHMTITERLHSLKDAWKMLPSGGLLVVVETPNRLWYFDNHTSQLPFFHWLPDELAFAYSRFSPRKNFRELYTGYSEASKEHFLRRGRGMSFHEFDIAVGEVSALTVISSLSTFQGIAYKLSRSRMDRRYKSNLMRIYPGIHEGFFDGFLHLIIKKG